MVLNNEYAGVKWHRLDRGPAVRLRAFDVDDATPADFDSDGIINEHPGKGNDNGYLPHEASIAGRFVTTHASAVTLELNANGEAVTQFPPGANYRIAALLDGFQNPLDALQVENDANPDYVPNGDEPLDDIIPGGISPTLTIWRKLHLEVDSIDEVPEEGPQKNVYTGTVTRLGEVKPEGYTTLSLSSVPGALNRFQYGRLTLNGSDYFIRSIKLPNTYIFFQEGFQQTIDAEIEIVGVLDSSVQGMTCILRDDDDLHRDEIGLHPSLPYDQHSAEIVEAIRPKFAPAFVEIVDANALDLNEEPRIPFRLNERVWGIFDSVNDAKDLIDTSSFWAHTLVVAYQPTVAVDMDPDEDGRGRLFGITAKMGMNTGYSVVFIEMFRDEGLVGSRSVRFPWTDSSASAARNSILSRFHGTIAHEVGHAPAKQSEPEDHNEGGLMRGDVEDEPPPSMSGDFSPASILRFRGCLKSRKNACY